MNAGTGFLFWLVAARSVDQPSIGVASSLFASVAFVNFATGMGVPTAIVRYAKEEDPAWVALYTWALALSALTSVLGTLIYAFLIGFHGSEAVGGVGWPSTVVLAAIVAGVALSFLIEVRLIAARQYRLVIVKNVTIGVARIGLLFVPLSGTAAASTFLASVLPQAAFALVIILWWSQRATPTLSLRPIPGSLGGVLRFSGVNYAASLALGAPMYGLPVIVSMFVPAEAYATFYVAWTIASVLFLAPAAIGQALLVEGSRGGGSIRRQAILALALSGGLMTIAFVITIAEPALVGIVFGSNYLHSGAVLAGLMFAAIPWAITSIAVSIARVRQQHVATLAITAALGVVVVFMAFVLTPADGVGGAVGAWSIGHVAAASVAVAYFMIRTIHWRERRRLSLQ